jgi:hypothetical protein
MVENRENKRYISTFKNIHMPQRQVISATRKGKPKIHKL